MTKEKSLTKRTQVNKDLYPNGIPQTVPEQLTLGEIIGVFPKEVFHKNMLWAWGQAALTIVCAIISIYWLSVSPWYLLPLAWIFAGTNMMGMFCVGHDCGHLSFSNSHFINDVVGNIFMSPLLYPLESWRIQHNHHHSHSSKLDVDNTWQPLQAAWYHTQNPAYQIILRGFRCSFYWLASVFAHQFQKHYFLREFKPEQYHKVKISIACCLTFSLIFIPLLYYTGVWGFIKFWFVPWIVFHFWLDTITLIHHTLPHLPYLPEDKWSQAQARLGLTVHCNYPAWVEWMTHHIGVHVPHHVCAAIPSYNLRMAHEVLKKNFGQYMTEVTFSWDLIRDITTNCHVYDEDLGYVTFEQSEKQFAAKSEGKKEL